MILIAVIIFLAGFFQSAHANQLCSNLARHACSSNRSYDDGTSIAPPKTDAEVSAAYHAEFRRKNVTPLQVARQILQRPDPDGLLVTHLMEFGNFGEYEPSSCVMESGQRVRNPRCDSAFETALAAVVDSHIYGTPVPSNFNNNTGLSENILYLQPVAEGIGAVIDRAEQSLVPPAKRQEVQRLFEQVKSSYSGIINRLQVSPEIRRRMMDRLRSMKLEISGCQNADLHFARPNASYFRERNAIVYCPSLLLATDSLFTLMGTLAHEIGHAFERCSLEAEGNTPTISAQTFSIELIAQHDQNHPFNNLISCLRSPSSSGARVCGIEALRCNFGDQSTQSACRRRYNNPEEPARQSACPSASAFPSHDQTSELVGDWFGAEVVADLMPQLRPNLSQKQWQAGISNIFSFQCQSQADLVAASRLAEERVLPCNGHPTTDVRINTIIGAQPRLREMMGCGGVSSSANYCSFNDEASAAVRGSSDRVSPNGSGSGSVNSGAVGTRRPGTQGKPAPVGTAR